jgi:hypothetical protein
MKIKYPLKIGIPFMKLLKNELMRESISKQFSQWIIGVYTQVEIAHNVIIENACRNRENTHFV